MALFYFNLASNLPKLISSLLFLSFISGRLFKFFFTISFLFFVLLGAQVIMLRSWKIHRTIDQYQNIQRGGQFNSNSRLGRHFKNYWISFISMLFHLLCQDQFGTLRKFTWFSCFQLSRVVTWMMAIAAFRLRCSIFALSSVGRAFAIFSIVVKPAECSCLALGKKFSWSAVLSIIR